MQSIEELQNLGFEKVYQGGHHAVFCNGALHVRTTWWKANAERQGENVMRIFKCDCDRWKG